MKKIQNHLKLILLITTLISFFTACNNIPKENRFIPVEENINASNQRTVLLEDFTGVKCVNCPKAAKTIEDIEKIYGSRVITVGLHGDENMTPKDHNLFSEDAAKYYQKFASGVGLPAGMINRKIFGGNNSCVISGYSTWAGFIKQELSLPRLFIISGSAKNNNDESVDIAVSVKKIEDKEIPSHLKLQVWAIENKLVYLQAGADDPNSYEHNHILRGAVNGTWGEELILDKEYSYQYKIPKLHDIDNCNIIAFVYDANTYEVLESLKIHINK